MSSIPALLMLPPCGASRVEHWLASARLAAASDLLQRLLDHPAFDPVYVLAADGEQRAFLVGMGGKAITESTVPFHFGRALGQIVEQQGLQQLAYFGGASAPLLLPDHLDQAIDKLRIDSNAQAVVNNLHSTDWIILSNTHALPQLAERLPADNPLGWVLSMEAGFLVETMPAAAATRLDIDTPIDVALLHDHPALGAHLRPLVDDLDPKLIQRVEQMRTLIKTPASSLAIIGRCSSQVWRALEENTQIWIRMFVEERGMVASRRLADGKVKSLIGRMVDELGPAEFLQRIKAMSDGLLWDNRVWMGMERAWPSQADRFAADLGLVDHISDRRLRELTQAVLEADFPLLVGGYGVVAGGVYALIESTFN